MKKIVLTIITIVFCQNMINAQDPIYVTITGECTFASGSYTYNGLVNGKNNYVQTVVIAGESFVLGVGFDSTKWVLYSNGDLTDPGFDNIAVPTGLLPPFIGWVQNGCLDGTMVISQTLHNGQIENFTDSISLYPNPSSNYMLIENKSKSNDVINYKIIDLTGRVVAAGNSTYNEKIVVEGLTNGNYLVEMKNENGQLATKKLIKN